MPLSRQTKSTSDSTEPFSTAMRQALAQSAICCELVRAAWAKTLLRETNDMGPTSSRSVFTPYARGSCDMASKDCFRARLRWIFGRLGQGGHRLEIGQQLRSRDI